MRRSGWRRQRARDGDVDEGRRAAVMLAHARHACVVTRLIGRVQMEVRRVARFQLDVRGLGENRLAEIVLVRKGGENAEHQHENENACAPQHQSVRLERVARARQSPAGTNRSRALNAQ